jgi:hypothetical protein
MNSYYLVRVKGVQLGRHFLFVKQCMYVVRSVIMVCFRTML